MSDKIDIFWLFFSSSYELFFKLLLGIFGALSFHLNPKVSLWHLITISLWDFDRKYVEYIVYFEKITTFRIQDLLIHE